MNPVQAIQALILGLVQGLTEFIPISSSGHLVLVPWLLGWPEPSAAFDAVLHLGTLAAILAVFWHDYIILAIAWVGSVRRRSLATAQTRVAWALVIATIPAAAMGYFGAKFFEGLFSAPGWVSVFLIVTGVLLVAGERWMSSARSLEQVGPGPALFIGLAQGIAIAPGISRSGATISAGRFLGLPRAEAARFSFLLAAPVIAGAGALQFVKLAGSGGLAQGLGPMLLGFVAALVSGYVVIRLLLSYVQRHSLLPFAIYCWVLGLVGLVVWFLR